MPRPSTGEYPPNWDEIALKIKDEAGWLCVRCGHVHQPKEGYCLTVHHLDGKKNNCVWHNLLPLCQRCHLTIQSKVDISQSWMWEHSSWFLPFLAGYLAHRNGLPDDREYVETHIEEILLLAKPNGLKKKGAVSV